MKKSVTQSAWLCPKPNSQPDRQLIVGDEFEVHQIDRDWVKGVSLKDGYQGWVQANQLGAWISATHWVCVRSTWAFSKPDVKSHAVASLHLNSRVQVVEENSEWSKILLSGMPVFLPTSHLRGVSDRFTCPLVPARLFLGTPYLWAGNSGFGLDCSGLVQAAYLACGWKCEADSGPQSRMPGNALEPDSILEAGDLLFWKGHVAMATGAQSMIHANAHHMSVVEEEIDPAIKRIGQTETGPVTLRLRPSRQRV